MLAQAVKSMGVNELASAATALQQQQGAGATPPATAGAAAGAAGAAPPPKPVVRRARKARGKKGGPAAPVSILMTQASGLEVAELEEEQEADPVMAATNRQAWAALCAAAAAVADEADASQPALAAGVEAAANGGKQQWGGRLKVLAGRLGKVLSAALATDPTAWTDVEEEEEEEGKEQEEKGSGAAAEDASSLPELLPGALKVDELAAAAAARAAELKADVAKGCKLRKRKALSDFLHALGALGLSKRASDVPAHERGVASWFMHAAPDLAALLRPTPLLAATPQLPTLDEEPTAPSAASADVLGTSPEALSDASAAWTKAGVYYYRTVARMQKLMSAAAAPHKDVSMAESQATVRYCDHLLYQARRQRAELGGVASAHESLKALSVWLGTLKANSNTSVDAQGGEAGSAATPAVPPQAQGTHWLQAQHARLAPLQLLVSETAQLLTACDTTLASSLTSAQASALSSAARACAAWQQQLGAARGALDAAVAASLARIPGLGNVTWVSQSAWAALASNYRLLQKLAAEAAEHVVPADDQGFVPPGLHKLQQQLAAAAVEGEAFLADMAASNSLATATSASAAQDALGAFSSELEAAVAQVLVWAQSLGPAQPAAPATPAAPVTAFAAAAAAAAAGLIPKVGLLMEWQAKLAAATQSERAAAVARSVYGLLQQVSALRDTTNPEDPSAAAALAYMVHRLSALAPLTALVAGGLQQQALRWVALHRACTKLAYISSSIFATLLEEGFCAPEGEGVESKDGGDGPGEWKEAEGTGMGDGDTSNAKVGV